MKKVIHLITVLTLVLLLGCGHLNTGTTKKADDSQPLNGEAVILQSWQGDYPVALLQLLPEKQRGQGVGFIGNADTFASIWKAFKPKEAIPEIDFSANLVLFVRNTQFFNRIRIGKVNACATEIMAVLRQQVNERVYQPTLREHCEAEKYDRSLYYLAQKHLIDTGAIRVLDPIRDGSGRSGKWIALEVSEP